MLYTESKDFIRISAYAYELKQEGVWVGTMKSGDRTPRIPINLTLSPEDKRWIKVYAAEHDMTVSDVLQQHIRVLQEKERDPDGKCESERGEGSEE